MSNEVIDLTADNFSEAFGTGTAVVDFWAPWCAPCRQQEPIIEEVGKELGDKVSVARLNVDDASDIAAEHNVRSVPSIIVFKDGKEARRFTGVQKKETLTQAIEEAS